MAFAVSGFPPDDMAKMRLHVKQTEIILKLGF